MNTPSETLAERIIERLIHEKLLTKQEGKKILPKLAEGKLRPEDWRPPIVKTVATSGEGLPELWAAIGDFRSRAATGAIRPGTRKSSMR